VWAEASILEAPNLLLLTDGNKSVWDRITKRIPKLAWCHNKPRS